jgi:hypothetical protein
MTKEKQNNKEMRPNKVKASIIIGIMIGLVIYTNLVYKKNTSGQSVLSFVGILLGEIIGAAFVVGLIYFTIRFFKREK